MDMPQFIEYPKQIVDVQLKVYSIHCSLVYWWMDFMWKMVLIYLTTVRMIDECGLRWGQVKSDKVKIINI
uniref:Uncharacterized protein n=1 Tax=Candidatus Methanogaster sp. ANME-2c ERB4 TaxID=2759911 RepID=A0A7G9YGK2_9EURY|nr:hypothetical protein ANPEMHCN_00015 [Methanosarcinales archaeon ANME-2c ERB4]